MRSRISEACRRGKSSKKVANAMAIAAGDTIAGAEQKSYVGTTGALRAVMSQNMPGGWATDHMAETDQFTGYNFLAINALGVQGAQAAAAVYYDGDGDKGSHRKMLRAELRREHPTISRTVLDKRTGSVAVPDDHRLVKLLNRPNPTQSGASLRYELIVQLSLTGTAIIWKVPNKFGLTVQRYIIPTAVAQPLPPSPEHPNGAYWIMPHSAHAQRGDQGYVETFGYMMAMGTVVDAAQAMIVRKSHPLYKDDGLSATAAGSLWIDTARMVDQSRWSQMDNGPDPSMLVEPPADIEASQTELNSYTDRLNEEWNSNNGRKVVVTPFGRAQAVTTAPKDMVYGESSEQLGGQIMALHGVTKAAVGLETGMTYGALAAALRGFSLLTCQPLMSMIAEEETEQQAPEFGKGLTVEYTVDCIDDPELDERKLVNDVSAGAITVDEIRVARGREPWGGERGSRIAGPQASSPWGAAGDVPGAASPGHESAAKPGGDDSASVLEDLSKPDVSLEGSRKMLQDHFDGLRNGHRSNGRNGHRSNGHAKSYSQSSVIASIPEPARSAMIAMGDKIDLSDTAGKGIERNPHVTLKYGLQTINPQDAILALQGSTPFEITFGPMMVFANENADVLVAEIDGGDDLLRMHDKLVESIPTIDGHAFNAHATIAYLKPGTGSRYASAMSLEGITATIDAVTFSPHSGARVNIPLVGAKMFRVAMENRFSIPGMYP